MTTFLNRNSEYPIDPLFLSRVSSRAFSEDPITDQELMTLFEAARWAPSSYNNQPWRFIYARKNDPEWDKFFSPLIEFNKSWCNKADTLVVVLAKKNFEHNDKPSLTAEFDTGAAWMSLALEANRLNIVAHGMQGFDYEAIRANLKIPDSYTVLAMVAIGKKGKIDSLPEELKSKETPSDRKPLKSIVNRGTFPA